MSHFQPRLVALAAVAAMLTACGGGGGAGSAGTTNDVVTPSAVSTSFPTGLAVAAPSDLAATTTTAAARLPWDGLRFAADWGRAAWGALQAGDAARLAQLATALLPLGQAYAGSGAGRAEIVDMAAKIEAVLSGDTSVSLAGVLDLGGLFQQGGNANCYGPQMLYASHQDGTPDAGQLPGGDLGLWLETEAASGQPCVVAQLGRRTFGVKHKTRQGLLLMAAMRATVAGSGTLSMPAAGASTDLTTAFATVLHAVPLFATTTVHAATVSRDSTGATYTYRLALSKGSGTAAKTGEVVLQHTPGADKTIYDGVMRVAGFELDSDPAFGCADKTSGGLYQRAHVTTLRYSRNGASVDFGARSSNYCGAPAATTDADYAGQVASFTSGGELDPAQKIPMGPPASAVTAGSSTGWRGSFERFGGDFDKDTGAGNFLYAWQAGTGDSHARALAATASYNSVSDERTVKGYFNFIGDIATTDGSLLGMICNWAGPGNNHTPVARFQSQIATLASAATTFSVTPGNSKITYAPTVSCSSTTTSFDANADATLAAGEGVGTSQALDAPASGSVTVNDEIVSRGYSKPGYF